MGKRRRGLSSSPGTIAKPFDEAFHIIKAMELCYCYRTVTFNYTAEDVIKWLWPRTILTALREASPFARPPYNSIYNDTLRVPGGPTIVCALDLSHANTMCPHLGWINFQSGPVGDVIVESLNAVAAAHRKFEQVRTVVTWLNNNATIGATAYYFPVLRSLLPAGHPLQEATGELYREPKRPIAEIAADMREAMTTIALGLLSYNGVVPRDAKNFLVSICHADEATTSQTFSLV